MAKKKVCGTFTLARDKCTETKDLRLIQWRGKRDYKQSMCPKCRSFFRGRWKFVVNRKTPKRKAGTVKEARELLERNERLMLKAAGDMTAIANRMKKHRDKVEYYRKRIAEMEAAVQEEPLTHRKLRL